MTESKGKPSRGGWKIVLAVFFLLTLAGGAGWYWNQFMRGVVSSNDARLAGQLLDIAPQTSGTLTQVYVDEGDAVQEGQLLFVLDQELCNVALTKAEAAVDSAKAGLAVSKAQYEKCVNGARLEEIRIAETVSQRAKAAEKLAESEWNRVKALHFERVMTKSARDKVRGNWEMARHVGEEADRRLVLLKKGSRREDLNAAKASMEMREAQLTVAETAVKLALISLARTEVRAPFDGVVVRRWQDPGIMISPARPVLTIMNPSTLHVTANIEEKHLNQIAVGDKVEISIDAYPDITMAGRVDKILPAANSQFSLLPSGGATGAFIKVAQRISIRIAVDEFPNLLLGPGLSVEIRINVNRLNTIHRPILANE
ncbi:MAG: HlyD family secretion protein [Deltaproteobacteria bacterium]|nr:HlyD family secretion protein [Deltaproteobacteria bacterium]